MYQIGVGKHGELNFLNLYIGGITFQCVALFTAIVQKKKKITLCLVSPCFYEVSAQSALLQPLGHLCTTVA